MSTGNLKTNNVHLEEHEYRTVKFLVEHGFDIELIPPSVIKGLQMPDLMINGIQWEMKAPEGAGKKTIENTMQNAARQSRNVVIDLRRCRLPEDKALRDINFHFKASKRIKRVMVITKDENLIDLSK